MNPRFTQQPADFALSGRSVREGLLDERSKMAFDFAREVTIQLITLATGTIALEVTLLKDVVKDAPHAVKSLALSSWIVLLFSIAIGIAAVMALAGTLQPKDESNKPPKIWEPSVRLYSGLQILSFLAGLSLSIIFVFEAMSASSVGPPRKLRVALYPFIPAYQEYLREIEKEFRALPGNETVDLELVELGIDYYDPSSKNYIASVEADVYEIDSVFLNDFVAMGKIRTLPKELVPKRGEFLDNALKATRFGGQWYGVPHWVCENFLFFRAGDRDMENVRTFSALQKVIGLAHQRGHGLLVDLKGKSTLGEFYLMSLYDRYGDWDLVSEHLTTYDQRQETDLRRLLRLCDRGNCRSGAYHDKTGFYARQFARRRGRALVGYSEVLYYAGTETLQSCTMEDQCVSINDVDVTEAPLDDGMHPISWVDLLVLNRACTGECEKNAIKFVQFVNSEETQLKVLTGTPPRYLLPARTSLYSNQTLLKYAHLYPKLKGFVEGAAAPTAIHLNETLRRFGRQLDGKLPTNQN